MDNKVDFMIHGLVKFQLFGQELWITTTHVCVLIVMLGLLIFAFVANRKIRQQKAKMENTPDSMEGPGIFQNLIEWMVESLDSMVTGTMGAKGKGFCNYIGTLFLFILISNISGLFGLRSPTADYGTTLCLGFITFVLIQYNNLRYNRGRAFTDLFKPLPFLFPINLMGEIAVPISLSLRLFGNVLSGTVLMALIYGLLPVFIKIGLPAVLHVYFDVFSGCIQTYVFCMLTMVFISQKMPEDMSLYSKKGELL